jgi:hypothetical protein
VFLAKAIVHVSVSTHTGPDIVQVGEGKRHKNRRQMKRSAYGLRLPAPKVVTLKLT